MNLGTYTITHEITKPKVNISTCMQGDSGGKGHTLTTDSKAKNKNESSYKYRSENAFLGSYV